MRGGEIIQKLNTAGWFEVRQTGSHKQFRYATISGTVTVPHPRAEMAIGTIKSIEKQSGTRLR